MMDWLGLVLFQGADSSAHKIFGRRKLTHRREATHNFVVHPSSPVRGLHT